MLYKSIFGRKPKKENKKEFCQRIVELLNHIEYVSDGSIYSNGFYMLNDMFRFSNLNNGYVDIDDLLNESDESFENIFDLCNSNNYEITEEEILINIDIIVNCLFNFKDNNNRHFYNKEKAFEIVDIIARAIKEYLLGYGYVLRYDEEKEQFFIVENDIAIDLDEIDDMKLKSEIISYYDYKNVDDLEEKKKVMFSLISKLESRKNDISKIMGNKIADMFSNYANNFNLRHNNVDENYKKYYNKQIADMNEEEILKWWNYIFAFMINVYLNLNKLKDVNINDSYK